MSLKNHFSVNFQNKFDNLIVTAVNEIELHESQDHKPTKYHKRCEIANTKTKSRVDKKKIHTGFVHLMQ